MTPLYITPHYNWSQTVHAIRGEIGKEGCLLVKEKGSKYEHNQKNFLVNWGSVSAQTKAYSAAGPILNKPAVVTLMNSRIRLLKAMAETGANVPFHTGNFDSVKKAFDAGETWLVRTRTREDDGRDIEFFSQATGDNLLKKFYVQYVPKVSEFRIHIFDGSIIGMEMQTTLAEDAHKKSVDPKYLDWRIRTRRNGFVYIAADAEAVPVDVRNQALKAFGGLGADFAAMECIYSGKTNRAYVIDASPNPVLEDKSIIKKYAEAIKEMAK